MRGCRTEGRCPDSACSVARRTIVSAVLFLLGAEWGADQHTSRRSKGWKGTIPVRYRCVFRGHQHEPYRSVGTTEQLCLPIRSQWKGVHCTLSRLVCEYPQQLYSLVSLPHCLANPPPKIIVTLFSAEDKNPNPHGPLLLRPAGVLCADGRSERFLRSPENTRPPARQATRLSDRRRRRAQCLRASQKEDRRAAARAGEKAEKLLARAR